jgi:TP901 family phage tail tape measure protein
LAQLGLAFGIGTIVRGGAESIMEFDQAVADLSAITGASGEDLQFFKEQARELGIEVDGGASAVVEAYKLIGSAKPELLENAQALNEVTKSAILLSQASGLELPEASKNLTSALNQFKAPAEEAGRFINVLANGAKFGSAEIPEITNALLKFGGVADSFNVSIEESVAMIELLRPSFKESAEVGTALRNIILKMSAPEGTPKLAKEFEKAGINVEKLSDKSLTFEERVRTLLPLLEDENAMVKVFGAQNIIGAKAMLTQVEAMDEMTAKMHTMGTIQEQANTRTQTLGHALMELKNSFTDLFLGITDGENSMQGLVTFLQWLTRNLPTIVTIIGKLVRAFVIYKTTMLALKGLNFIVSGGFKDIGREMAKQIPLTKAYTREQKRLANEQKGAVTSATNFGKALAGIGFTMAIGLVIELAQAWWDVASNTAEARRQQDLLNNVRENFDKSKLGLQLSNETKEIEKQMVALEQQIRLRKAQGENEDELNKELAQGRLTLSKSLVTSLNEELKTRKQTKALVEENVQFVKDMTLKVGAIQKDGTKQTADEIDVEIASLKMLAKARGVAFETDITGRFLAITTREKLLKSYAIQVEENKVAIEKYSEAVENAKKQQTELGIQLAEANGEQKDYSLNIEKSGKSKSDATDNEKTFKTELKDTNIYLSRQIDLLQELTEIEQERQLISAQKDIDAEFERQLKLLEDTGEFEVDALNEMIRKKTEMEKGFIDQRVQYEMDAVDRKIKLQEQKENDALIKERDRLLAQADITQEAIDKINADYDIKEKELQAQQLKREKDAETEKVIIHEQGINDKKELDDEYLESIDEYNDKLVDKQKEANRVVFESTEAIVKASADYFIQQSERKIEQVEKEISMAEKQADTLSALAEQGNIDAQESLAEQQKIIAEANRKKLEEQKRQQRIQLAQSVYSTYTAKVNANSKNPLAETIRDTQVLNQFIQSLPTFFDGTEDTGTNGRGIDGKGGFLSVLHPNERVVPKSLNDQIGSMSNDELSQLAMEYQNGKMVRSDSQISSALELAVLVNRLDNLTKVIQDKPETNIELGEITQGAMEIVKSTKKGNTIVYNRYKVK